MCWVIWQCWDDFGSFVQIDVPISIVVGVVVVVVVVGMISIEVVVAVVNDSKGWILLASVVVIDCYD